MLVKNLIAWAGHDFSYGPGDVVDLPEEVAAARIAAELAEAIADPKAKPGPAKAKG